MAEWPSNGVTDWNTKMKANIDVGHDADGTHKKTQMLTDMEWSPTTYAGEESVTFPNGLVFKHGVVAQSGTGATVTFGTAFETAIISASGTGFKNDALQKFPPYLKTATTSALVFFQPNNPGFTSIHWQAWGY